MLREMEDSFIHSTGVYLIAILLLFFLALAWLWSKNNSWPLPPGPPGFPLIGHIHLIGDHPSISLRNLSKIYGPIMHIRLGCVPAVVISTPEAAEMLLRHNDASIASKPKAQVSKFMSYGGKGIVSSEYGPYWRKMRKLCSIHLFSSLMIDSFECTRKNEVGHLVTRLRAAAEASEVVDIGSEVGQAIEKIAYRMIFGNREINERITPIIHKCFKLATATNLADFIPFIGAFDPQGFTRRWKAVMKVMDEFLDKIIHEHDQYTMEQRDRMGGFLNVLLSLMRSNNAKEEKLDREHIKANTLELLAGAMDTTTGTTEWALSEILRHPQVMKKVQQELENVVGLHRLVEEKDLAKLDYLNMVVKESMRLHPVAAIFVREAVEDISINGFHIPKKTWIITNNWAIGRDPAAWPEKTEDFFPERFINCSVDVRGHDMQLLPFGSGRRRCPGMELGIRTVQLVLAQLLHCFNWEPTDGKSSKDIDMHEDFGLTVTRATPLLLVPTYRLQDNQFRVGL